jgi:hypothetical protein
LFQSQLKLILVLDNRLHGVLDFLNFLLHASHLLFLVFEQLWDVSVLGQDGVGFMLSFLARAFCFLALQSQLLELLLDAQVAGLLHLHEFVAAGSFVR